MRETCDGSLLLELPKGSKLVSAAKSIAAAISEKLGDSVGKVSQLGVQVEVEVLDLDAVSSTAEVLEARLHPSLQYFIQEIKRSLKKLKKQMSNQRNNQWPKELPMTFCSSVASKIVQLAEITIRLQGHRS
ncbi:hypothetical protein ACI65C_004057 [Semiaphis heraclei]